MSAVVILAVAAYVAVEWLVAVLIASVIGWGWTIVAGLVLVILGIAIMRRAGMSAGRALRDGTSRGPVPSPAGTGAAVGDASLLFVAGALVAVPGFVTSAIGLVLALVPPLRRLLALTIGARFVRGLQRRGMSMTSTVDASGARVTRIVPGEVVEGEVVVDHPHDDRPGPDRPQLRNP